MDHKLIAEQTKMETEALSHVARALEVALEWVVEGDDLSRKLSSVRFAAELYQRIIERLFALEELDGYMKMICRLHPERTEQVEKMKQEHQQFRTVVRKLILRLDRASPTDRAKLDATCNELKIVIQQILEHNQRETEMFVESLLRDTGGQG